MAARTSVFLVFAFALFLCSFLNGNAFQTRWCFIPSSLHHFRHSIHSLAASKSKDMHFSPLSPAVQVGAVQQKDSMQDRGTGQNELSFVVYGEPMPLQRHRVLRSGISYNPSSKLQNEFLDACSAVLPSTPMEGPLEVRMVFYFKRPLNHYGTGKKNTTLKNGVDIWHSKRKDIDNLAKFVLDAINKKAYIDDGQVSILSTAKLYTERDPRVEVRIRKLADEDVMFAQNFDQPQ